VFLRCSQLRSTIQHPRRIGRTQRLSGPGAASAVRLSKIDDYLADNFRVLMLSEVMGWVQEQTDRIVGLNPNLGIPRKGPGWRPRCGYVETGYTKHGREPGHQAIIWAAGPAFYSLIQISYTSSSVPPLPDNVVQHLTSTFVMSWLEDRLTVCVVFEKPEPTINMLFHVLPPSKLY
jgi:hypothetical protein